MPTAAKVIMFPRVTVLECRVCDQEFWAGTDYDFSQDCLCGQCLMLKEALKHKRAMVPRKALGAMAILSMLVTAAVILGIGYLAAMIFQAVREWL